MAGVALVALLVSGCTPTVADDSTPAASSSVDENADVSTEAPISTVPPASECERVGDALTALGTAVPNAFAEVGSDPAAAVSSLNSAADDFAASTEGVTGNAATVVQQVGDATTTLISNVEAATKGTVDVPKLTAAANEFTSAAMEAAQGCLGG